MLKTLVRAVVLAGAVFAAAPAAAAQETGLSGVVAASAPTARQAAASMGKGFNLGQMFDNDQHPPTLRAARPKIAAYYARGFRTVRIPVTWTEVVGAGRLADPDTGALNPDEPRLAELIAVIDYALAQPDMFVVLNAHHEKALKESGRSAVLERLWADIAERLVDRDHRLIFEILNEPHLENGDPMAPETLRAMTGAAYRQIRARSHDRIVVIGGNQWFGAHEMARTWPNLDAVGGGSDPFVMATFHHYNPWEFAGDNQGDYADAWTDADIREPMKIMDDWARTIGQGMPVFIGEWGVGWGSRLATPDCNNVRLWYSRFHLAHASPMAMPTAVWDDGGWYQLFDHDRNAFNGDLIDCIDGACTWTGAERFNSACF